MRGLIKFIKIPNIAVIETQQKKLAEALAGRIFNELQYKSVGDYLLDLINNEVYNTIAADYDVIKNLEFGSVIYLSSNSTDWYDGETLIDHWFKAEKPDFYRMDLNCEVISKSIIGNYFLVNVKVIDIGNLLYAPTIQL